ncbi:unnamed protein product [Oreochromis niloticus]|nr:unnamed protein product [Mustela putorius furo]
MSPETSSGCNQQRTPRSGYLHAEQKTQQRQDGTSWPHSGSTNTWKEEPTVQTQGHRMGVDNRAESLHHAVNTPVEFRHRQC